MLLIYLMDHDPRQPFWKLFCLQTITRYGFNTKMVPLMSVYGWAGWVGGGWCQAGVALVPLPSSSCPLFTFTRGFLPASLWVAGCGGGPSQCCSWWQPAAPQPSPAPPPRSAPAAPLSSSAPRTRPGARHAAVQSAGRIHRWERREQT